MVRASSRLAVAGIIGAAVCGAAALIASEGGAGPSYDVPAPLEAQIAAIRWAASDSQRARLLYELVGGIERGQITIKTPREAEMLARFMANRVEHDTSRLLRSKAADFLAHYPHPIASEALLQAACQGQEVTTRQSAQEALVALRDRRVLPCLAADLRRSGRINPTVIRLMAELGDRGARKPLVAIADDPRADPRAREAASRALRALALGPGTVNAFELDEETLREVNRKGFAIRPGDVNEMYEVYMGGYPLVTTDLAFHTFVILMRATLDELEPLVLAPRIHDLSRRLAMASLDLARDLGSSDLAPLARENAAFFAVAVDLLGGADDLKVKLPAREVELVATEVERIRTHRTIQTSTLFDCKEDYTKYKPRGRHGTRELSGYFGALTYYGRMIFRLESADETRRALLILDVLDRNPELRAEWEEIDRILGLLFGERDDLAFPDYELAARESPGARPSGDYRRQAADDLALAEIATRLRSRPAPRINTAYVSWPESMDWRSKTMGLRIFGQRYTRAIGLLQSRLDGGEWPLSGLMVAADLLGSKRASQLLGAKVVPASRNASTPAPPLSSEPNPSLAEGYLRAASTLFDLPAGAPPFMSRPAWEEKQINTALGAWAEIQHTTAGYTKDATIYACASAMADRFHGYVEPYPLFYRHLNQLVSHVRQCLDACDLFERIAEDRAAVLAKLDDSLSGGDYEGKVRRDTAAMRLERRHFEELSTILDQLERIATMELRGEGQSIEDGVFLKSLHPRLKELAFNRSNSDRAPRSMAGVIDVATEYQRGECFEIGVGRPAILYAAIPDGGRTFICQGAIYTYYEFTRPAMKRLNDGEWQELLAYPGPETPSPWLSTRGALADRASVRVSPGLPASRP